MNDTCCIDLPLILRLLVVHCCNYWCEWDNVANVITTAALLVLHRVACGFSCRFHRIFFDNFCHESFTESTIEGIGTFKPNLRSKSPKDSRKSINSCLTVRRILRSCVRVCLIIAIISLQEVVDHSQVDSLLPTVNLRMANSPVTTNEWIEGCDKNCNRVN